MYRISDIKARIIDENEFWICGPNSKTLQLKVIISTVITFFNVTVVILIYSYSGNQVDLKLFKQIGKGYSR